MEEIRIKSNMKSVGIEDVTPRREASAQQPELWHGEKVLGTREGTDIRSAFTANNSSVNVKEQATKKTAIEMRRPELTVA
jgi:hypothetical protein